ncbi:hypothetical protein J7M23_12940 [Candidatus Sumerlaeota bacterium]|nr:hypothetical protein [Candidatus Sumerlaeota bacterium]
MKKQILCIIGMLGIMMIAVPIVGQLNPFETGGAEEPLLESSPSGGLSASTYTGRAREAVRGPFEPPPAPVAPKEREAIPPEMMGPEMAMMMRAEMGAQPTPQLPTPTPFVRMIRVVTGRRVKCAVTGELLEDVRYEEVPETMKDQFYDDGTHGDEVANDGTYTNIEEINDVIGPKALELEIKLINLLLAAESYGPLGFFRLFTLTDEPVSLIPKRILTEEDLDTKLESWANIFLRMFRKNKDDIYSEFYSLYVPPPPLKPKYPMPPGFNPVEMEKAKEAQKKMGVGVLGEPIGAASSRYYETEMFMGR